MYVYKIIVFIILGCSETKNQQMKQNGEKQFTCLGDLI